MRPAAALALAWLLPAAAAAEPPAPERELTLTNNSRQAINEVYVAPSAAEQWGEDRLGEQTLPRGQARHLRLGHTRDCLFDVLVVYDDASREESDRVDLCRMHALGFAAAAAVPPAPLHPLTIANNAPRPIQQVFVSPANAGDWGQDRLAHGSLSVGDATRVPYRGDCVADVRVVFDNRSAEERRGVDVCATPSIVVQPGWTTADAPQAAPPAVGGTAMLTVTNRSGHAATALYVFPEGSTERGPELLSSGGLDDRAQVAVALRRPAGVCRFAAEVTFAAGAPAETFSGLDLCGTPTLVIPPPARG